MNLKIRIFLLLLTYLAVSGKAFTQNGSYIGEKKHYYGAAYYPEGWNFKNVDEDILRMKELGMNVMRMGEFAWSSMEPTEGNFQFAWLHEIIDKLYANGIHVILGTPTATPPAWLAEKHPEMFLVEEDGTSLTHGGRRNCSYTSEVFKDYSRKIITEMAREFGRHPGVIGWQTDNELSLHPDFSEETRGRWHKWLSEHYESIEQLNELWGTRLWSQSYNSFTQIPFPKSTVWHNPSLQLAWHRFNNDMIVEFQNIHLEVIRAHSDHPITHDGMPNQRVDYEELFRDLDFMAFNVYHGWQVYNRIQSNYDRVRSYGKGFHWLLETAPNNSGGGPQGQTWFIHQPLGGMRAAIWMNHALGGQGSLFWLWRQHRAGHEMPHGSIISAWNKPAANYEDIKQVGMELKATSDFLMNAPVPKAETAILYCHVNSHMLNIENYSNGISFYTDWTNLFYRPISDEFIHRDVIHQGAELEGYKLLVAPLIPMIRDDMRAKIMSWVENGGILLMGPMSGYRTEEWASFTDYAMGSLEPWMDIYVESRIPIDASNPLGTIPLMVEFKDSQFTGTHETAFWSESLNSPKGNVLATYAGGMHAGKPAIIEKKVGKGKVVFLGTYPGKTAFQQMVRQYASEAGIKPMATGDKDILVAPRAGQGEGVVIINLTNYPKKLSLQNQGGTDLLTGTRGRLNELQLKPYDVKVIRFE
jgi:beta-galactosidase